MPNNDESDEDIAQDAAFDLSCRHVDARKAHQLNPFEDLQVSCLIEINENLLSIASALRRIAKSSERGEP